MLNFNGRIKWENTNKIENIIGNVLFKGKQLFKKCIIQYVLVCSSGATITMVSVQKELFLLSPQKESLHNYIH